jgi:branched-chain amino acid transport system permease protein
MSTSLQAAPSASTAPEPQTGARSPFRIIALVGALLLIVTPFLPWAYGASALDDMTVAGYPSTLQFMALGLGVLIAALLVGSIVWKSRRRRVGWVRGAKALALGAVIFLVIILGAISLELGGLVNVEIGGWLALAGAAVALVGTLRLVNERTPNLGGVVARPALEILSIVVLMAAVLFASAYALGLRDGGAFVGFLVVAGCLVAALIRTGVMGFLSGVSRRHRQVLILAAFVVAFLFPFTQNGSNANMSIATQVIIFAATAMGLNIVVGLAGLLDLGYIAFLGAGAYVAAIFSKSSFATADIHPPFIVVVLMSGIVAAGLGLIIGTPTLRVSGDYLAIVTLAFGEIFRISMNNLDGQNGPDITHGPNGIPAIPDLELLGFNFGEEHTVFGIELGKFSNYYFLLLLVIGLIILVFVRLNNSRIGRGWVAIREDEKAAEAMGVNVFGLKLFAFAGGAFLAGVAGAVKAHQDVSVTPEQYVFLESGFLVAAIVLGGMGTVLGVLIGATLLKLLPEKLRFVNDYRLLIFGLLLIVMMRFRPEGMVANERRQLEFHDEDEELAERIDDQHVDANAARGTT